MKFLHIGNNICGIPNSIARAQRESGHEAKVLSFERDAQGHVSDLLIETDYKIDKLFALLFRREEVFFFVGDTPFAGVDILLWKLLGKKVVIEYHGSEVRGKGKRFFHRYADALFVSTPDLLKDVPEATWLPNPIFIEDYKEHYTIDTIVVHSTTNRILSGTTYFLESFEQVKKILPFVTLDLVEDVPYKEALERYRKATVVVEKLCTVGYPGMIALECMAMGVPVICYVSEDLKKYFKGTAPICFTDVAAIKKDLLELLTNPQNQQEYSILGKEYVNRVHNPGVIAATINKALEILT